MAQKTVQIIIGRILTDEEFRKDFLAQPVETLVALRERGLELTNVEVDAIALTDRRLWRAGPDWIDTRLQCCQLLPPSGGKRD